ncbi:MAG: multidrug effflux MFS transporter [Lautropia sp.]|nr:multidrug effflux MFS transporter [Lautropia sp.]
MFKNTGITLVLAMLTMVGALGIDAYLPSFPAIITDLQITPLEMQQTLSVYIAMMAITVLFAGTLSDALGRRPVMLGAMLLFGAASVLAVFADSLTMLLLARALQGVGAGISMVLSRTVVQDRFAGAEAQRVMALITMVFSIAPSVAPVIGGWLQQAFGWHSVFILMAAYALLLWLLCHRGMPETLPPAQRTPMRLGAIFGNYGLALRTPRFVLMVLAIGLIFTGIALYISSASAYLIGILGLKETDFGWMFIPLTIGMLAGASIARRLARKVSPQRLTALGFTLVLLACISSVLYTRLATPTVPWAVLPLGLYSLGMSIALPGMTVAALSIFPQMRGLAASLQSFVQMGFFSLVSAFIAPHVFHSAEALAWTHLAGVSLGVVLWVLGSRMAPPAATPAGMGPQLAPDMKKPAAR